ncbi:winged helix-turn-helix domain-containing protein [Streptomyces sp. NPDC056601]|uniref:winged helix-turn-helix domain-containing protein n=1 Tax=Streptomyces sp. NPDC056601 TaxID=3345875 RepID=UPI0036B0432B
MHRRFGVEYTLAGMDLLLHRIDWSVQVPSRKATERDETKTATWKGEQARHKKTAADLGARLCFEDEAGQGLRPPKGRIWGRRGHTRRARHRSGHQTRFHGGIDLHQVRPPAPADLSHPPRPRPSQGTAQGLHRDRLRTPAGRRTPVTRRPDRPSLGQFEHARQSHHAPACRRPIVHQLPPYAPEFEPVEGIWSHLKRSLVNLIKHSLDQLTALAKTWPKRMQYRPGLIDGLIAKTGLDFQPQ